MKATLLAILAAFCLSFGAGAIDFSGGYEFDGFYPEHGIRVNYKYAVITTGFFVDDSLIMMVDFLYSNTGHPKLTEDITPIFEVRIESEKRHLELYYGTPRFLCFQANDSEYLDAECVKEIRIPFSKGKFDLSLRDNELKKIKGNYTKKVPRFFIDCFETIKGGTCED